MNVCRQLITSIQATLLLRAVPGMLAFVRIQHCFQAAVACDTWLRSVAFLAIKYIYYNSWPSGAQQTCEMRLYSAKF